MKSFKQVLGMGVVALCFSASAMAADKPTPATTTEATPAAASDTAASAPAAVTKKLSYKKAKAACQQENPALKGKDLNKCAKEKQHAPSA